MMKKKGLGRRLEELLAGSQQSVSLREFSKTTATAEHLALQQVAITNIMPGHYQPRRAFQNDNLQELGDSIKAQGMIQPIVLQAVGDNQYEIIAGERRWRAAKLIGLTSVPAIIRKVDDKTALAMSLIENIQRQALNSLEEAQALQKLVDEFSLNHLEIAKAIGRSRTAVTNKLRLLKLNDRVKNLLACGDIEAGHAKALLALNSSDQMKVANMIVNKALSVRETEKLVRRWHLPKKSPKPIAIDPNTSQLQKRLSDTLGTKVIVEQGTNGRGKLVIFYHSLDGLEGILSHVR